MLWLLPTPSLNPRTNTHPPFLQQYPHTHPPNFPLTHPTTHSPTQLPTHPPNYPLTHPTTHSPTQLPTHPPNYPLTHPPIFPAISVSMTTSLDMVIIAYGALVEDWIESTAATHCKEATMKNYTIIFLYNKIYIQ